jgi:hypothetical protein
LRDEKGNYGVSDTIEFNTVSLEEWKQIPAPVPPKPKDRFEKLIASVRAGNIVKLEVTEEKALRGMRIGIARKARNAGFLVEFRNLGNVLLARS